MATDHFSLHAWADESARTVGVPEPVYLLGAVVADPAEVGDLRGRMQLLRLHGSKLHWREMDARHRDRAIEVIADLDVFHVVTIGTPMNPRKPERARALCLERLAWELAEQHHVERLTLEARPRALMQRDHRTIDSLRGTGALPRGLRLDHGDPKTDPMLWIADQVLGAIGENEAGRARWFTDVGAAVEITRIGL